ncbi:MAG TPA: phosphatidylglycerophosphatase A [Gammaproteobacteria bacterium]|jgi:phosphatidylglycerophosphatase A|nr:phosphatidylglycerophosphatase A [Gammaproteobacteria bacterium]
MANLAPRSIWTNPIHFLAFGFGSGAAPVAPGTFGTLAAMLLYWLAPPLSPMVYCVLLVVTTVLGIWLCGRTSKDLGVHDHGGIVWDEFVGYWITMFMAPAGVIWMLVGFGLFRVFDIAKPWPIKWADEKVEGGLGIMLDDVIAGILACLCLQGMVFFVG